jgi:DUF3102 family protein
MHTYQTLEVAKVPGHKTTEPAFQHLFEAKRLKDEREKSFNGGFLTDDKRGEYLDSIKEELKIRSQGFKFQIYEMGKLLWEAKKILPHGKFIAWINENFEFCYRTAFNFIKVYRVCMGHPEVVKYFNPSCLYVISKPDFPQDLRAALFNGVKGPVDIKEKDLVQLALNYKNGKLKTTDKEVQDILKKQRDTSLWEKYKTELEALNLLIANRLERIEKISTIDSVNPLIEKDTDEELLNRNEEEVKIANDIKGFMSKIKLMIQELEEKCK